jgi:hypothetical protein
MRTPEIDSLKLRIPLNRVTILNKRLSGRIILVPFDKVTKKQYREENENLDFNEKFKNEALLFQSDTGIKTRYIVRREVTRLNNVKEFLVIGLSSKVLEAPYLEGITSKNICIAYKNLMKQGLIEVSYDNFLNGECTDVDIKKDYPFKQPLKSYIDTFEKYTKANRDGYRPFKNKENVGFQWSKRETTGFMTRPYLKIYDKEIELKTKSANFANAYLKPESYKGLVRIETTIKDRSHFKALGVTNTTLKNILGLPIEIKEKAILRALDSHLMKVDKATMEKSKRLPPSERDIHNTLLIGMESGLGFYEVRQRMLMGFEGNTLRRKSKAIEGVYLAQMSGSPLDKKVTTLDNFFKSLGIK